MKLVNKFVLLSALIFSAGLNVAHAAAPKDTQKTVVLVHGAWADGSGWSAVIPLLQAKGLKVVAVQNPLTSLADDVAAAKRVIDNQTGPVILVGHSWGGMVITEAGIDDKVNALVYVSAFAPDVGDSAGSLLAGYPATPGLGQATPDASGYLYLSPEGFKDDFAQDLPEDVTKVMQATQGPIFNTCFTDKITSTAWKTKPSWYIVSENDRMIQPDMERAMAAKIKATTSSLAASHVPMLSKPVDVANTIIDAANSIK